MWWPSKLKKYSEVRSWRSLDLGTSSKMVKVTGCDLHVDFAGIAVWFWEIILETGSSFRKTVWKAWGERFVFCIRRVPLWMERWNGCTCIGVRINVFWKLLTYIVKERKEINICLCQWFDHCKLAYRVAGWDTQSLSCYGTFKYVHRWLECWVVRPSFAGGNLDLGVISVPIEHKEMKWTIQWEKAALDRENPEDLQ